MNFFFIFLFFKILLISNISLAQQDNENKINKINYASVIMYHRFGEKRYPSTNIKIEQFLEHIDELLKPQYNVIDINDGLKAIENIKLIRDRS
ncbi:MAG: polysaccharide deacetylase family protein, partial [Candidatus Puniceispirillales bacterium]